MQPITNPYEYFNEDQVIKKLEDFNATTDDLQALLRQLAKTGTVKGLQHIERLRNKKTFSREQLGFTIALLSAKHRRPYQFPLLQYADDYTYHTTGSSNIRLTALPKEQLLAILEHHVDSTYGFKLYENNSFIFTANNKECLIVTGNSRANNLFNAIADNKCVVGLIYIHCHIKLRWCLSGFMFSEPRKEKVLINIYDLNGNLCFLGSGKIKGRRMEIDMTNFDPKGYLHSYSQLTISKNNITLNEGLFNSPTLVSRNTVLTEH